MHFGGAAPAQPGGGGTVGGTLQMLIAREIRSRFSGDGLGYAWTYVVPLAWIGVIYFAFDVFGRIVPFHTDVVSFILSGMLPYLAFRFTVTAIVRARVTARQLLVLPGVSQDMAYTAAAVVEFYNGLILYAILAAANFAIFGFLEIDEPLMALTGYALGWALGGAFGYFMVSIAGRHEIVIRAIPVVLRPMFFLSGVFFTANELSGTALDILPYNPLLHAIEITRDGLFLSYESRISDFGYPLLWIISLCLAGWLVQRPLDGSVAAAAE